MGPQNTFPLPTKPSRAPLLAAVILAILLIVSLAFGYWAFSGRQDYKTNVDKKIATAVAAAEVTQKTTLQKQFDEQSKSPYKTFTGPSTYGSITFQYPKTWSAYVDESGSGNSLVDGYFHPDQVPGVSGQAAYALRVQLTNDDYATVLQQFDTFTSGGQAKASAYIPPKMKNVASVQVGTRIDGVIDRANDSSNITGAMVVMKVRDKTLKVYTESNDFLSDFNNTILPSLTFAP